MNIFSFSCTCIEFCNMLGSLIQIIVAIALTLLLLAIGFSIYNMEKINAIKESGTIRKEVVIYNGIKDLKDSETFNTFNPLGTNYRNLSPAINQRGGAEYSYSFWLYIDYTAANFKAAETSLKTTDGNLKDYNAYVLLLRGNPITTKYKSICSDENKLRIKDDVLVKNPMIRLDNAGDALVVEFNTYQTPDPVIQNTQNVCNVTSSNWLETNIQRFGVKSLRTTFDKQWFMVTVIIQDTYPTDPLPMRNKTRVQIYINEEKKVDAYADGRVNENASSNPSILRTAAANLYVAPDIKSGTTSVTKKVTGGKSLLLSDLSYFNYAVDSITISERYKKGHSTTYATPETSTLDSDPADLKATASSEGTSAIA